jgi:hypothetical protein
LVLFKFCFCLLCGLLFQGTCGSKFGDSQTASSTSLAAVATTQSAVITNGTQPGATKAIPTFDACSLLTPSEIASVQGTAVQQTQPTGYAYGELNISQCYYTAITSDGKNLSVHLQVIERNANSARRDAVNEFWKARFKHASKEDESKEKREEEKAKEIEEEDAPGDPISVRGIGDEAFWLASNRGGALFVLRDHKLVRVTIGGSDAAKTQIEKSKTLARKALARLK